MEKYQHSAPQIQANIRIYLCFHLWLCTGTRQTTLKVLNQSTVDLEQRTFKEADGDVKTKNRIKQEHIFSPLSCGGE
jgi:hypothetical protein